MDVRRYGACAAGKWRPRVALDVRRMAAAPQASDAGGEGVVQHHAGAGVRCCRRRRRATAAANCSPQPLLVGPPPLQGIPVAHPGGGIPVAYPACGAAIGGGVGASGRVMDMWEQFLASEAYRNANTAGANTAAGGAVPPPPPPPTPPPARRRRVELSLQPLLAKLRLGLHTTAAATRFRWPIIIGQPPLQQWPLQGPSDTYYIPTMRY